jgi:hypothetical protein
VDLSSLPSTLLEGESVFCQIQLTNTGSVPLSSLVIISDQPNTLIPLRKQPESDIYGSTTHTDTHSISIPSQLISTSCIHLPLSPKTSSYTLPILVHGTTTGLQTVGLLFAYASKAEPNRYFTARRLITIKVEPSVQLELSISPSFNSDAPFTLGLEIANAHAEESVQIDSICAISPLWRVAKSADVQRQVIRFSASHLMFEQSYRKWTIDQSCLRCRRSFDKRRPLPAYIYAEQARTTIARRGRLEGASARIGRDLLFAS